jgi:hypothetical protein
VRQSALEEFKFYLETIVHAKFLGVLTNRFLELMENLMKL